MNRLLLLALVPLLLSLGTPETPSWTGRVSVVGNGMFAALTLTEPSGRQWRLVGDAVKDLWKQAPLLRVKVTGHTQGRDAIVVESWAQAPEETP